MVPEFALNWVQTLGICESTLVKLKGGINSPVYSCGTGDNMLVIKGYSPYSHGVSDRMLAEIDFLNYASEVSPGLTPNLIDINLENRSIIIEYIKGTTFSIHSPPSSHDIEDAIHFFRALNNDLDKARLFINLNASDGFLSINDHLTNIRTRLDSITSQSIPNIYKEHASSIISRAKSMYESVFDFVHIAIDKSFVVDSLTASDLCISPSDFGFHNAIKTADGIKFIDFEYAGWDDPCKAVIDFSLQPRIPINSSTFPLLSAFSPFLLLF